MGTGGCRQFTAWQRQRMDTALPREKLQWISHCRHHPLILRVKMNTKEKNKNKRGRKQII